MASVSGNGLVAQPGRGGGTKLISTIALSMTVISQQEQEVVGRQTEEDQKDKETG